MSISERIEAIFKADFGSQEQFAEATNISRTSISKYISGKKKPSFAFVESLFNLGYSLNWLFSGIGTMKREDNQKEYLLENLDEILEEYLKNELDEKINKTIDEEIVTYLSDFISSTNSDNASEAIKNRPKLSVNDLIEISFYKSIYLNILWARVRKELDSLNIDYNTMRKVYEMYQTNQFNNRFIQVGKVITPIDLSIFGDISKDEFEKLLTFSSIIKDFEEYGGFNSKDFFKTHLELYLKILDNESLFNRLKNEVTSRSILDYNNTRFKTPTEIKEELDK